MNLEKRIEQLEHRIGSTEDFVLIVIAAIGCNPDKMGSEREIHYAPVGYRASSGDREWACWPGESVEDLKARIEREVRAEGHRVYAVRECYA